MAMLIHTQYGNIMAVIMVNFGNEQHGTIRHLAGMQKNERRPFFRGPRAPINRGDFILVHDMKKIYGFVEFWKYGSYKGKNLQGLPVTKRNAIWVTGPLYKFLNPVPFSPSDNPAHRWNYIGQPLVSTSTFRAVQAQGQRAYPCKI